VNDIKVICFDLGGVLVRISDDWADANSRTDVPMRVSLDEPALWEQVQPLFFAYEAGNVDDDTYLSQVAQLAPYTADEVAQVHDAFLVDVYPEAKELLEQLQQTDMALACLSNTNARHWHTMIHQTPSRFEVLRQMDHYCASHLINCRKPDGQVFSAFEKSVKVQGEAIIFFDDREENIAAARQRGWDAHLIDPANDPPRQAGEYLRKRGVLN
jgi:HAD superfamily hydrolase (TIGR01509 family)